MQDPNYPILIDNPPSDLSDSANHTIYYNIMLYILGEPHRDIRYLFFDIKTGLAKRHPDRELNSFTRDQFVPFLAYQALIPTVWDEPDYITTEGAESRAAVWDEPDYITTEGAESRAAVRRFYKLVKNNNGFFFNSVGSDGKRIKKWWDRDWLDPQSRSLWARYNNNKRWMHYIGDLNLYLTIRFKDKFRPFSEADENIHCHLIVSKLVRPTFITRWCWDYYFFKTKMNWKDKITGFFDRGGRYYPEIPPIAIKALEKLLGEKWQK